jgi:hypothetical protein
VGVVSAVAGVIAVVATIVLGIVPYLRRRREPSEVTGGAGEPSHTEPPDQGGGETRAADPIHSLGVGIYARSLRNEAGGTIRADGPGSSVNLVADDIVNAGTVSADQNGPGTRLADHLRVIAGHIAGDAAQWDPGSRHSQQDGAFAAQYVRYGRGRQAAELYDSAAKAGLGTSLFRAAFECATTPDEARRVAYELVRWADELDRERQ